MSEQADIFHSNTTTSWKQYRHQISSSWKSNNCNFFKNHRRKSIPFVLNYTNRQQRGKRITKHIEQQTGRYHRHHNLLTFPLNLKLNFNRLGARRNSHKTGHKGTTAKAYVCGAKKRSISEAGSNTGIDIHRFRQKMANTLSVMTNVLRNVVSKQRIRYKEKGFNLDLACK